MVDNIVATATAQGEAAISIIRASGPTVIDEVNKITTIDLKNLSPNTINYMHIKEEGNVIDEVLVSVFKGPKSFTGHDTVEINSHGGNFVTYKVLEILLKQDIRMADPGEFTKQALLSGRIDLVQSESIMDIIKAQNESSLNLAVSNVSGKATKQVKDLKDELLEIVAQIEVNIDYPEDVDVEELTSQKIEPKVLELREKLDVMLENAKIGSVVTKGIQTSIVGRPNVGKSSLLNMISKKDKAIVTDIAGTTRDIIEESVNIGNTTLHLIDTAGIRNTEDVVEKIGVSRSYESISKSQFVLVVLDSSSKLTKEDEEILEYSKDKERIIVVNKIDLDKKLELDEKLIEQEDIIFITTQSDTDYTKIVLAIENKLGLNKFDSSMHSYLTNARHIAQIEKSKQAFDRALLNIKNGELIDIIQIDLQQAWYELGEILGENDVDSLLDEMFAKFCLGK